MAEQVAMSVNSVIFRTNFFGYEGGIVKWIVNSCKQKLNIKLIKDIYFSPLHAHTLSKLILNACENFYPGVYNLGSNGKMSKKDFILMIFKLLGIKTSYSQVSLKNFKFLCKRPSDMSMNVKKFEKIYEKRLPLLKNEIKKILLEI